MCRTTIFSMNGSDNACPLLSSAPNWRWRSCTIICQNFQANSGSASCIMCFYHISETNRKTRLWCWLGLKQLRIVFRIYLNRLQCEFHQLQNGRPHWSGLQEVMPLLPPCHSICLQLWLSTLKHPPPVPCTQSQTSSQAYCKVMVKAMAPPSWKAVYVGSPIPFLRKAIPASTIQRQMTNHPKTLQLSHLHFWIPSWIR